MRKLRVTARSKLASLTETSSYGGYRIPSIVCCHMIPYSHCEELVTSLVPIRSCERLIVLGTQAITPYYALARVKANVLSPCSIRCNELSFVLVYTYVPYIYMVCTCTREQDVVPDAASREREIVYYHLHIYYIIN